MKKVLISGCNGFVGSYLVNKLTKKYQVIGIARNVIKEKDIVIIKKDIRRITLKQVPKNISCIIHLAAKTHLGSCQNNPNECFSVNVMGTQNLLEIARKTNSKFVFLSTSHVYGSPKLLPIKENHPTNPTSNYSASKLMGEILCESYAKSYGLKISILRLFSAYGPLEPNYRVTSNIISQLLSKPQVSVGNLYPKRDFIYIEDVVNAIELIIRKSNNFNIFNVGCEKSYSISELFLILKRLTKTKKSIKSIKSLSRKNEIKNVVSDCSRIKKLGWKPKFNLETGLKLTFKWFLKNHQKYA